MVVISPVNRATDWCTPMVMVPKKNGDLRICVDLTGLNEDVKKRYYLIPHIETSFAQLVGTTVLSKFDANHGFWKIPLDET